MRRILIVLAIIFALNGCVFQTEKENNEIIEQNRATIEQASQEAPKDSVNATEPENSNDQDIKTEGETGPIETPEEPKLIIPESFVLDVAFASQAPNGDWGAPYQDACEEASLITAYKYFKNEILDKQIMNEEILNLVDWEKKHFGFYESTDTEQTLEIAQKYFNFDAYITDDVSVDRIKKELVLGRLILLPTAGRTLGNPNFTGEGPLYHMLVVRGYDKDEFITNDVGTRKGEAYKYTYDVLLNSVHDYNKGDIYNGTKEMIVINGLK